MNKIVSEQNIPEHEKKGKLYWDAYASLEYLSVEELGQLEYEIQREMRNRGVNID